ncbi:uncharacterized protein LOC132062380 [Lycium ferocissimum]|uniref:uncharacterized protein LOC132062380 n=1 Tax=Lycium ferocissimum TaxID=112874 RepID=UPI0028169BB3|nr:uncharacterized protein LOC132062380 [Lycium ferocissimum]
MDCCDRGFIEAQSKVKVTQVLWKMPENGWIKINIDRTSRGNPTRSSWEICIRNEYGDVIQAQAKEMEDPQSTTTEAEALAILQALRFVRANPMDQIRIETDSLLVKNIIQRTWEVPWKVVSMVEEIWKIMEEKMVVVEYIYMERNVTPKKILCRLRCE